MISNEFKENVNSRNVFTIRSALIDYLIMDTSFKKFDEAIEYTKQQHIEILEPFSESEIDSIEQNSDKWSNDYLNRQKCGLIDNFSQERIEHLKKVILKVFINEPNAEETEKVSITDKKKERILPRIHNFIKDIRNGIRKFNNLDLIIIGGLIVATTGGITAGTGVLAAKPVIVKAGWSVAGVGGVFTVSGIAVKNLKSK